MVIHSACLSLARSPRTASTHAYERHCILFVCCFLHFDSLFLRLKSSLLLPVFLLSPCPLCLPPSFSLCPKCPFPPCRHRCACPLPRSHRPTITLTHPAAPRCAPFFFFFLCYSSQARAFLFGFALLSLFSESHSRVSSLPPLTLLLSCLFFPLFFFLVLAHPRIHRGTVPYPRARTIPTARKEKRKEKKSTQQQKGRAQSYK